MLVEDGEGDAAVRLFAGARIVGVDRQAFAIADGVEPFDTDATLDQRIDNRVGKRVV